MNTSAWFKEILDKTSSNFFHIEYNGFLSNHITHGIIALYRLGANEARINKFIEWYKIKLESPLKKEIPSLTEGNELLNYYDQLIGKRTNYLELVDYYNKLYIQNEGNFTVLFSKVWPKLVDGLSGSLLHGFIHLGYGLGCNHIPTIIDGLAYIHHSFSPLQATNRLDLNPRIFGSIDADSDLTTILKKMTNQLTDVMLNLEKGSQEQNKVTSNLQRRISVLHYPKQSNILLDLISKIKVEKEYLNSNSDLAYYVLRLSIQLFTVCQHKNDFVLVHGITSAWSLVNIIKHIESDELARRTITVHSAVLFSAYIIQMSPELGPFEFSNSKDIDKNCWQKLINDLLEDHNDLDEHVYKTVQVCHDVWLDKKWPECFDAAKIAVTFPIAID